MATPDLTPKLAMQPEGSLNKLSINSLLLDRQDPLVNTPSLCGKTLVSRQALLEILEDTGHGDAGNLRRFLGRFDPQSHRDQIVLDRYAQRFSVVINTARTASAWPGDDAYRRSLRAYWQSITTLVISGGLTSAEFGQSLAQSVEQRSQNLAVICSPWGGNTALLGLAQTAACADDILVMDFGGTGIKRAIAHRFGNRLTLLPEAKTKDFCEQGRIRKAGLMLALRQTRQLLDRPLPVAISIASYLDHGHPYRYFSSLYHGLTEDSDHLATSLHQEWLPESDLGPLLLLEHDSAAAGLAFRFREPAMMVTLGTGLGSAPCPMIKS
ncbi:hypothetical protein [Reinekea blandensis]|uniref:Uncharacterized protein n=1 Tax=Reinekea blandensis MED297 TaxID=314283 RepID=A4B9B3_9GAMM|nr:hypothetical protein [Reinekea blandensis]EAR11214.1 hypothetical protein MED297_20042 [Reinekea sp. MED297] [Reinekea blandensis MED297]